MVWTHFAFFRGYNVIIVIYIVGTFAQKDYEQVLKYRACLQGKLLTVDEILSEFAGQNRKRHSHKEQPVTAVAKLYFLSFARQDISHCF